MSDVIKKQQDFFRSEMKKVFAGLLGLEFFLPNEEVDLVVTLHTSGGRQVGQSTTASIKDAELTDNHFLFLIVKPVHLHDAYLKFVLPESNAPGYFLSIPHNLYLFSCDTLSITVTEICNLIY